MAPPIPDTAVPIVAAPTNIITLSGLLSVKPGPWQRPINQAVSTASPALHNPNRTDPQKLRSPSRFAKMVAASVPKTTGHRARKPSAIRAPADTPDAGQKTATPSGLVSNSRLSRAAMKYARAIATVSAIAPIHLVRSKAADISRWTLVNSICHGVDASTSTENVPTY